MRCHAFTMLLAAVTVACGGDAGTSPPPLRIVPTEAPSSPSLHSSDPKAPNGVTARGDGRRVLMRLAESGVRLGSGPPRLPTSKSYVNPWASEAEQQRGVDVRLNWQTGERNEWVLEAALAIPFPSAGSRAMPSASWDIDVPQGARLEVDLAVVAPRGVHVGSAATITLSGSALTAGPASWSLTPSRGDRPLRRTRDDVAIGPGTLELTMAGDLDDATLVWANPAITVPAQKRPNLLLIVVDSQRADTVGPGAVQAGRSAIFPTMERLYDRGTGFRHAFSAGNLTRLSTFAFLTGQTPRFGRFHSTAWDLTPEDKARFYGGAPPLLGATLRAHGYRSAAIGNDVFLFGHLDIGLDADFDTVWDYRNSTEDTPWMTDRAIAWLEARQKAPATPFFLLVNYNAPHKPYDPPPEAVTRLVGGLRDPAFDPLDRDYLGEIAWVDLHLERLLASVERLGLGDDTVIAFTADHGEVMNPLHKCYNATLDKYCFRNHGQTLFDEELHVPLAVVWPERIAPGRIVDVPVSLIDLAPTFHALSGLPADPRHVGRDLSEMLLGGPEVPEAPVRAESRRAVALRSSTLKYIWNDPSMDARFRLDTLWNPMDGSEELYDLAADPMELVNLAPTVAAPDVGPSEGLRSALFAQDDALEARRGQPKTGWVLAFGAGRLSGRITTLGRFEDVQGAARSSAGSKLTLDRIGPAMVRFRTVPADIPVHLELTLDGAAVAAGDIGIGAYGLRSLSSLRLDDATVRAAATAPETGPTAPPTLLPTLRLWRVDQDARAVSGTGGADVDDEVRAMMTTWGYQ